MISIDQIAYRSGLRKIDPLIKLITAIAALFTGLFANSYLVSGIIIVVMSWVIVKYGGARLKHLLMLMMVPISFLILSIVTIILQRADNPNNLLLYIKIQSWYYGFSIYNMDFVGRILCKAIAAISCMYFLALTTPMTELFSALKRLKIPKLMIELMELIYRFIFVLTDTANQIHTAQASRLGYNGLRSSYKSLGVLVSMVFVRAYKRSDRIYTALESRGYNGELNMMEMEYDRNTKYYLWSGIMIALLNTVALLEGLVIK